MDSGTRWSPFTKQLVLIALLIGTVYLLFRAAVIIPPLIIALVLAYMISVPVPWVQRNTGWSRTAAVGLTELIIVLLVLTVPAAAAPWFMNAVNAFANTLTRVITELVRATPEPIEITPNLVINLGPFYQPINQWLRSMVGEDINAISNLPNLLTPFASGLTTVLRGAVSGIIWFFFILVVAFYAVRDGPRAARFVATRVPEMWRPELGRLWRELTQIWDAFVRGQLMLGLIVGLVVWILMAILGVRNATILGLISALFEFVPSIGPVLAAIPGVAIALVLGSSWLPLPNLWFALLVALVYITVQQVENLYLLPRVVGSRIRLHPAIVIVGALAGSALGGILGILLAAPTIAGARTLGGYALRKIFDLDPFAEPETPDRRQLWGELVQKRSIAAVLFDIDGTLVETDDALARSISNRLSLSPALMSAERGIALARRGVMTLEGPVNLAITLLDRVKLDNAAYRLRRWAQRATGQKEAPCAEPVEGTVEALRVLRSRGYLLGVVTSRDRDEALMILQCSDLQPFIGAVVTREDTVRMKPHPMPIRLAAQQLGVSPEQCIMVGDTGVDIRSGKAAGALAVGVRSGFGEDRDFAEADLVLDTSAQLVTWL